MPDESPSKSRIEVEPSPRSLNGDKSFEFSVNNPNPFGEDKYAKWSRFQKETTAQDDYKESLKNKLLKKFPSPNNISDI